MHPVARLVLCCVFGWGFPGAFSFSNHLVAWWLGCHSHTCVGCDALSSFLTRIYVTFFAMFLNPIPKHDNSTVLVSWSATILNVMP